MTEATHLQYGLLSAFVIKTFFPLNMHNLSNGNDQSSLKYVHS